jgi:hypothetical protein
MVQIHGKDMVQINGEDTVHGSDQKKKKTKKTEKQKTNKTKQQQTGMGTDTIKWETQTRVPVFFISTILFNIFIR